MSNSPNGELKKFELTKTIPERRTVRLMLLLLGIWFSARLPTLGAAPLTGGEKQEVFDYYQEGQKGRGLRRVLILDLGDRVTLELVRIQGGKFQMGSPLGGRERLADEDQHGVEITRDFYLGKYEVTRGQFRAF